MSILLTICTGIGIILLSALALGLIYGAIMVFIEHFASTQYITTQLQRHSEILDHYRDELDNLKKKNKK
jgi:uncharacterized membrane-anchored protein YhcB (DUF1043 family)